MISFLTTGNIRRRVLVAGCAAVAAVGLAAVPTTASAGETPGTCHGTSLTKYGYRTSCEKGSFYDRVHYGNLEATFAIRGDRAVIYASPNHGWVRVSTGKADYIKFVDATSSGFELVCVELKNGHLYSSTYDRHRGWSRFSAGCPMG